MPATTAVTANQAKILKFIQSEKEISQPKLVETTKLDQVVVAKTILELSEMGLLDSIEKTEQEIALTKEGKSYLKVGLPEKQVFVELQKVKGKILLDDFKEKSGLDPLLVNIAIGWLRRKNWVEFSKEGKKTFVESKKMTEDLDEQVLTSIKNNEIQKMLKDPKVQESIKNLSKRKILIVNEKRIRIAKLTSEGQKILKKGLKIQDKLETTLTPKMIITGSWRKKKFKAYDPTEDVPVTYFGRRHPIIEVVNEMREIFFEMGFHEIRGPIVESEFWNFDALFQPQDHPAREMHDTFKLAQPNKADLPPKEIVDNVAKTHQNGWKTKSKGFVKGVFLQNKKNGKNKFNGILLYEVI